MIYSVDRIEGGFAVLVGGDGKIRSKRLTDLPRICEGDILEYSEKDGFSFCAELTEERKKRIARRTKALFKKE